MKFGARLMIIAATFLVMFGIVGIRLWFVQVAEGAHSAELVEDKPGSRSTANLPEATSTTATEL